MLEFAFRHSSHMSLVSCQSLSIKCQSERVEFDNLVRLPHNPIFGEIDYLVSRKVCRKSCHEKVSEYKNILFVGNQIYRKSIFTSSRNRFTMSPFLPIMLPTSWKGVTSLSSLKFLLIRKKKELQYHNLLWSKWRILFSFAQKLMNSHRDWQKDVAGWEVFLMQNHLFYSPQKTFPLAWRAPANATLGNNAMKRRGKRGLIEQIAFWLSRLFSLCISSLLSLSEYIQLLLGGEAFDQRREIEGVLGPCVGWWVKEGKGGVYLLCPALSAEW